MSSLFTFNRSTFRSTQSTLLGARLYPFSASLLQPSPANELFIREAHHREEESSSQKTSTRELQGEARAPTQFFAREDNEVRTYTAFKRFRPGGPHPPVPPVGAQFFSKDAFADSIENKSSLQTSTSSKMFTNI